MWNAARRQERMIRGMMVDYQKRAGRRKEYYDQIKQDPNQFLRVNGTSMRIHIDAALASAAEAPIIMQKWQGDDETMIDRYDARSHIDSLDPVVPTKEFLDIEESRCNYERYRILVQNDSVTVTEQQCLMQIEQDEEYGCTELVSKEEEKKKKSAEKRAAIGYTYDDNNKNKTDANLKSNPVVTNDCITTTENIEEDEEDLEEIDLDNILDIELLSEEQEALLNHHSHVYSMLGDDYAEFLQCDRDEMEALRRVREIAEEKAAFSGRKSRRERKAFKDERMKKWTWDSPSYLNKGSPKFKKTSRRRDSSSSRSRSPGEERVEFITSFGGIVTVIESDEEKKEKNEGRKDEKEEVVKTSELLQSEVPTNTLSSMNIKKRRSRSRSKITRSRSKRSRSRSQRKRRSRSKSKDRRSRSRSKERRSKRKRSKSPDIKFRSSRRSRSPRKYKSVTKPQLLVGRRDRSVSRSLTRSSSSSSSSIPRKQHHSSDDKVSSSSSSSSPSATTSAPIKKYRRDSLSSSSEFGDSDSGADESRGGESGVSQFGVTSVSGRSSVFNSKLECTKTHSFNGKPLQSSSQASTKFMTPQQKLQRKMQLTLKKQYKADKKARLEKENKDEQLKQDREEELRLLSIQLRQREREKRHREREEMDKLEAEYKRSRSSSKSRRKKSRSRSRRRKNSKSRSKDSKRRSHSRTRRRRSPKSSSRRRPKLVDY